MKAVVFGAAGQVGQALRRTAPHPDVRFIDRAVADLADPDAIASVLRDARPDLVINAAAYTSVDGAESEPALAYAINETAPAIMAATCATLGARLVHLSTDHVFDGASRRPYRVDDAPRPINAYGSSKWAGEQRVRDTAGLDYLVIRTSWVYSHLARNFFFTMLDLARRYGRVRAVTDQYGSPTSAWTLADAIWRAAGTSGWAGTAHFTDGAEISRHDFAVQIMRTATEAGLPFGHVTVDPISTVAFAAEHPSAAPRPAYGVLDSSGFRARAGLGPPDWRASLCDVIMQYVRVEHG